MLAMALVWRPVRHGRAASSWLGHGSGPAVPSTCRAGIGFNAIAPGPPWQAFRPSGGPSSRQLLPSARSTDRRAKLMGVQSGDPVSISSCSSWPWSIMFRPPAPGLIRTIWRIKVQKPANRNRHRWGAEHLDAPPPTPGTAVTGHARRTRRPTPPSHGPAVSGHRAGEGTRCTTRAEELARSARCLFAGHCSLLAPLFRPPRPSGIPRPSFSFWIDKQGGPEAPRSTPSVRAPVGSWPAIVSALVGIMQGLSAARARVPGWRPWLFAADLRPGIAAVPSPELLGGKAGRASSNVHRREGLELAVPVTHGLALAGILSEAAGGDVQHRPRGEDAHRRPWWRSVGREALGP